MIRLHWRNSSTISGRDRSRARMGINIQTPARLLAVLTLTMGDHIAPRVTETIVGGYDDGSGRRTTTADYESCRQKISLQAPESAMR